MIPKQDWRARFLSWLALKIGADFVGIVWEKSSWYMTIKRKLKDTE